MIPDSVQSALLNPKLLQEWAAYSVCERVALIREKFDIEMSKNTLSRFYGANGVKYKSVKRKYRQELIKEDDLEIERRLFCVKLAEAVANNRPIIYFDES